MTEENQQLLYQVYLTGLGAQIILNNMSHLSAEKQKKEALRRAIKLGISIDPLREPYQASKKSWIVPSAAVKVGEIVAANSADEAVASVAFLENLTEQDLVAELVW